MYNEVEGWSWEVVQQSVAIHCSRFRVGKRGLKQLAQKALALKGVEGKLEVIFVGKKEIKELNRRYLGKAHSTDVLAFSLSGKDFILPSGKDAFLGQIFICYPQAKAQAKKYGHSLQEELSLLIVHGILHLLGFKDETEEERSVMREEEHRLLAFF